MSMVEWKKLGDICNILDSQRKPVSKGDRKEGVYPYYGANGIQDYVDSFIFDGTYLLMGEDGSVINTDKSPVIHWATGKIWVNNHAHVLEENDSAYLRYIYYSLQCTDVSDLVRGVPPKINQANMRGILIPVPSKNEQNRIVGILDTFTASIDNLKEQIAQRRKQYEYYRDQLLDLEGKEGVEMKYITDVAKSFTGLTYKPEHVSDSGTLVLRSSNIKEDVLSFDDNVYVQMLIPERAKVHENDILICVRNGSKRLVGKSAMITKEAEGMAFGAFMTILRSFAINSKFLFYVWQSDKVRKQYKGDEAMPIAQITAKDFQRIEIPIPSLQDQQRIVSILDTFEASIQNLEAQLSQREKQYEYYRNKLLTFE